MDNILETTTTTPKKKKHLAMGSINKAILAYSVLLSSPPPPGVEKCRDWSVPQICKSTGLVCISYQIAFLLLTKREKSIWKGPDGRLETLEVNINSFNLELIHLY